MSRRMFDFLCDRKHRHEALVQDGVHSVACPRCGQVATRLISAPRIALDGTSGDFPTAAAKWEQRRESHMKRERHNKENHGTYE